MLIPCLFLLVKLLIENGFSLFGENRVQEANEKFSNLAEFNFELHLIGPLQTNKVKPALSLFDTIQSIDRHKLVKEISKQIKKLKKKNQKKTEMLSPLNL